MEKRVRKLGTEKQTDFDKNFDEYIDKYKSKAKEQGYEGKLKFTKERGRVVIFVELDI
jgi:hypothetical protein